MKQKHLNHDNENVSIRNKAKSQGTTHPDNAPNQISNQNLHTQDEKSFTKIDEHID